MRRMEKNALLVRILLERLRQLLKEFDQIGQNPVLGIIGLKCIPVTFLNEEFAKTVNPFGKRRIYRKNSTPCRDGTGIVPGTIAIQNAQLLQNRKFFIICRRQLDTTFHDACKIHPPLLALIKRLQRGYRLLILRIIPKNVIPDFNRNPVVAQFRFRNIRHLAQKRYLVGHFVNALKLLAMHVNEFFPVPTFRI